MDAKIPPPPLTSRSAIADNSERKWLKLQLSIVLALYLAGTILMISTSIYLTVHKPALGDTPASFRRVHLRCAQSNNSLVPRKSTRQTFLADQRNGDPLTVELDDAGLQFVARLFTIRIEWPAIQNLVQTPALLLIIDDTRETFIVPRRAFASVESEEEFSRIVWEHMGK